MNLLTGMAPSPSTPKVRLLASSFTTRELGPLTDAPPSPVDIATHLSEAMSKIPSDLALPVFRSRHLQKIDVFVNSGRPGLTEHPRLAPAANGNCG